MKKGKWEYKKITIVWIIADRKVNGVGYLFRNGKCVCFNHKPQKRSICDKIIKCDLIIPVQGRYEKRS